MTGLSIVGRIRLTLRRRRALGDLFQGPYPYW